MILSAPAGGLKTNCFEFDSVSSKGGNFVEIRFNLLQIVFRINF